MKTFIVIPAAYAAPYELQADHLQVAGTEVATLYDDQKKLVAVISLKNVAAVYEVIK